MGCSSTKSAESNMSNSNRRRLSVGKVDETADGSADNASQEEDRGAIASLNDTAIMDLLKSTDPGTGRKMSLGSVTDTSKTSFSNKSTAIVAADGGDVSDADRFGLGYTCRKGLKPESPNQDSWLILKMEERSIYGVFDGHGQKGHDVSNFVKENLPKFLLKDLKYGEGESKDLGGALTNAFYQTQQAIMRCDRIKKLSASLSGTTASVCVHEHDGTHNRITVAHVADSTCVLGRCVDNKWEQVQLTRDHKPDLKDERARIEKNGGRVVFDGYANHRIYAKNARYPGLNMSRCLGDLLGHQDCGLSAVPEIFEKDLEPADQLLMLCSDGVWEFIQFQEAVDLVTREKVPKVQQAADKLAKEAWDRWIREEGGAVVDDITVILIYLQEATRKKA